MTQPKRASPSAPVRALWIVVFGLWLIKTTLAPLDSLAFLPRTLFEPVGFLALLPDGMLRVLLDPAVLAALWIAVIVALILALTGIARTAAALAACLLITLEQAIIRGFEGHIHHSDLVLLYAAYLLALFRVADALARRRPPGSIPALPGSTDRTLVAAVLAILCLSYTLTGTYRLIHGGLETFRVGSATFWGLRNSYQLAHPAWGLGKLLLPHPFLSHLLDISFPIVTLFESAAVFALISRPFRWAFLGVAVGLHLLSWLFLEVFFWENLFLLAFFLDPLALRVPFGRALPESGLAAARDP